MAAEGRLWVANDWPAGLRTSHGGVSTSFDERRTVVVVPVERQSDPSRRRLRLRKDRRVRRRRMGWGRWEGVGGLVYIVGFYSHFKRAKTCLKS